MQEKLLTEKEKDQVNLLASAFKNFTSATHTLKNSYQILQHRIKELTEELRETNKTLTRKIIELKKLKMYLKNTLDSMMNGLVVIDLEGRITIFNKAAEDITGYRAKDVLGKNYREVFEKENPELTCILQKSFEKEYSVIGEKSFVFKGKKVFIEIFVNLLLNQERKKEGFVVVFRDVSMLRHLQEEMRRKEKLAALGQMAATIAHEIRNPLSGIEGFAFLLRENIKVDETKRVWIENIIKGARDLNVLVTELLDFSRPLKIRFQRIIMEEIIEDALSFIKRKIQSEGNKICVKKEFFSNNVETMGDPHLLKRVFLNIAINALEAMGSKGELTVRLRKKTFPSRNYHQMIIESSDGEYTVAGLSGEAVVEFIDTGCGIESENLEKIFLPFYTTKPRGAGLGLAVVQQIIQEHRGNIRVESQKGKGSTFILTLPLITCQGEK